MSTTDVTDDDLLTPEAIRTAREAAGWSISEAVRELRVMAPEALPPSSSLIRAWKRWEKSTRPSRYYRPLLIRLLRLDDPTAPSTEALPDVSGVWYASWQSSHDQQEVVGVQRVECTQRGEHIWWKAVDRGYPVGGGEPFTVETGGYLWQGELKLWDNKLLIGWYAADDGSVLSKGAVHLVLHPQGQKLTGRWSGLSYDGDHETGLGAMARTEHGVKDLMKQLLDREG